VELRGFEPHTEPGEITLELRFLLFGVVTQVVGFLGICAGVLRDVTVPDRLAWRAPIRGVVCGTGKSARKTTNRLTQILSRALERFRGGLELDRA
jgi:hypothetical protein